MAFKIETTFKVAVKLQVVGHPTVNATFVVSKAGKRDVIHFPALVVSFSFRCNFINVLLLDLMTLTKGSSVDSLKALVLMGMCISFHLARHLAHSRLLTLPGCRKHLHGKIIEVNRF